MNPPSRFLLARPRRAGRLAVAAVCFGLAGLAAWRYRDLAAERTALARSLDLPEASLRGEGELDTARLRAVRAVLTAELAPRHFRSEEEIRDARRQGAERLERAAGVAGEVLARRPGSWEAAWGLGAATYLGWSLAEDPRLFTEYRRWEAPLESAVTLSQARREPLRFLAAAYLEVWPALSEAKRERTRELLLQVFRDPEGLKMLLAPWLAIAPDREAAFAAIPDDPIAWSALLDALMTRRDWEGWTAARSRWDRALLARLDADLEKAAEIAARGDLPRARTLCLSVAADARIDTRYLGVLSRALAQCPAGPVEQHIAQRLRPHLEAEIDRCLLGRCGLSPESLERLAVFAGDVPAPTAAMAALLTGQRARAAALERRATELWSEAWSPYLVLKARDAARRGAVEEAREALAQTHSAWRGRLPYLYASLEAGQNAGNPERIAEARARLSGRTATAWTAGDWENLASGVSRLEMATAGNARGLALTLADIPAGGAVIELRLDGAILGAFPVARPAGGEGDQAAVLELAVPLARGLHLLEVETPLGGRVLPGAVELVG